MPPKLVTFDCAGTLVEARWNVGEFALSCARTAGLDLPDTAGGAYAALVRERYNEYLRLNMTRDHVRCEAFWENLTADWLTAQGFWPSDWLQKVREVSEEEGFSERSTIFTVYDDVRPCLEMLRAAGARLAILSNWDYSLHKILRSLSLDSYFEFVVASLEHGFEKPDPRIFQMALDKFSVAPHEAAHVGDDAIDDLGGAKDVGMQAILIDRARAPRPAAPFVSTLLEIPERLGWSG